MPLHWRLVGIAMVGAFLAAAVAAATAANPGASPAHFAVAFRVLMILTLIGSGIYAQTSKIQARMGGLLIAAGLSSSAWLLNGSRDRTLFGVGAIGAAIAQVAFAYLLLAHPTGRLRSAAERRLVAVGFLAAAIWTAYITLTGQPPLKTGLMQCVPHCRPPPWSLGVSKHTVAALKVPVVAGWVALVGGVVLALTRRTWSGSAPVRASYIPVAAFTVVNAVLLVLYLGALAGGVPAEHEVSAAYVVVQLAVPVAILLGLAWQRMFMGHALAEFVTRLAALPEADPQIMLAEAIRDPSLKVAYRRPGRDVYVDSCGGEVVAVADGQVVSWIERDRSPVAAVMFSRELADQSEFVAAAGAASLIRIEKAQVEAELKASMADLTASRARLVGSAQAERRRLERDLHDGVQQHLVALRIKLDQAAETVKRDPLEGARAVAAVGQRMDDVLHELRSLARGIYPALLLDRGLGDALKSAANSSPVPAVVRARGIGRYSQATEIAVYFCCLEALQNAAKHGGQDARATVTLWEDRGRLCFEIRDSGIGFDPEHVGSGSGLTNMRDRMQAIGGGITITSRPGWRTSARGWAPVG